MFRDLDHNSSVGPRIRNIAMEASTTELLSKIRDDDSAAVDRRLPILDDDLRRVSAHKLCDENAVITSALARADLAGRPALYPRPGSFLLNVR